MPGIFGLIITDPEKADGQPIFHAMKQLLFHRPWYEFESFVSENVFLGSVSIHSHKVETITVDGNEYTVLIDGHIFSIRGSLETDGQGLGRTIPERIARLFVSEGISGLHNIEGNYSVAIYNRDNEELIIFNDQIVEGASTMHIFGACWYFLRKKAISFLPDFDAGLNWKGIADFFNFGYVLGEDTFFETVKSFPSAGILTIRRKDNQIKSQKYFHPVYSERNVDFQTTVDEGMHKLANSINEKISDGDHIISPISGEARFPDHPWNLASSGRRISVKPITYGQKFSYEYKNAKKVCEILGIDKHALVEMGPEESPE